MEACEAPLREYLTPLLALDDRLSLEMRKGEPHSK
jgi:hypothetical protein